MGLFQDLLAHKITSLSKEQLNGVIYIRPNCFYKQTKLTQVEIPDSVECIGSTAFNGCSALKKITFGKKISYIGGLVFGGCSALVEIDTDNINPYCIFNSLELGIDEIPWYTNHPEGSMITMAAGQILIGNKISTPSLGFNIPDTVKNIAPYGCERYGDTVDSDFTSIVVPDTVEMIQASAFSGQTALTKITIGASVKRITGTITPGTNVKNVIFRQPAGMTIELPTAGADYGMFYDKSSYSLDVYTDNEYIQNYDWATDNVTVTIHPLSEAPA